MQVTPLITVSSISAATPYVEEKAVYLVIGIFDGVHMGHRKIITSAIKEAEKRQGLVVVLTFSPHPSKLIPNRPAAELIYPVEIKERILHELGVDIIIEQPFTQKFLQTPAEAFLPMLKECIPGLKSIFVGENFQFGHERKGDAAFLLKQGKEFSVQVEVIKKIKVKGEEVSSSLIRKSLREGDLEKAEKLLGSSYHLYGVLKTPVAKDSDAEPGLDFCSFYQPELKLMFGIYFGELVFDSEDNVPVILLYKEGSINVMPLSEEILKESTGEVKLEIHEAMPDEDLNYLNELMEADKNWKNQ